uniref:Collagen type XXVIII alpha 1 chain n=1 Tax=Latimeria chalumnae TaxID=7897 RepID=H3B2V2_LATCH
ISPDPKASEHHARVAVLQHAPYEYETNSSLPPVKVDFSLTDYSSKEQMQEFLRNKMTQLEGVRAMGRAVEYAVQNIFETAPHPRNFKVLILMTTGENNKEEAERLHRTIVDAKCKGYFFVVIAIGKKVSTKDLSKLASEPNEVFFKNVDKSSQLHNEVLLRFGELMPKFITSENAFYLPTEVRKNCEWFQSDQPDKTPFTHLHKPTPEEGARLSLHFYLPFTIFAPKSAISRMKKKKKGSRPQLHYWFLYQCLSMKYSQWCPCLGITQSQTHCSWSANNSVRAISNCPFQTAFKLQKQHRFFLPSRKGNKENHSSKPEKPTGDPVPPLQFSTVQSLPLPPPLTKISHLALGPPSPALTNGQITTVARCVIKAHSPAVGPSSQVTLSVMIYSSCPHRPKQQVRRKKKIPINVFTLDGGAGGIHALFVTGSSATLRWMNPEPQHSYTYDVTVASVTNHSLILKKNITDTEVLVEGLTNGQQYRVSVKAYLQSQVKAIYKGIFSTNKISQLPPQSMALSRRLKTTAKIKIKIPPLFLITTDRCQLQKEEGLCRNFIVKWYYDAEKNSCTRFWYGGCGGNSNRFNTQDECEKTCVSGTCM